MGRRDGTNEARDSERIAGLPPRLYWGFQATFWSAVFLWRTAYTWAYGYGFNGIGLRTASVAIAVGITVTFSLWLARFIDHRVRFGQFAMIAVVALIIGALHTGIDRIIYSSARNGWAFALPTTDEFLQILSVNDWVFLSWTAFFLVILSMHRASRRRIAYERMCQFANEAKLQMLTSQLNPHFLLNTLNSVSALIVDGRTKEAEQMVGRLGRFLNRVIRVQQMEKTTLAQEIDLITDYLEIQKIRFGDRLAYDFDIDPGCREALTPALILQPIVENAVQHGIADKVGGGRLTVCARRDAADVRLEVSDDGCGFDPDRMTPGLGLSIVRDRLSAHYGDAGRLAIDAGPGAGARIVLEVPAEKAAETRSIEEAFG